MAGWKDKYQTGSFRGVPFYLQSHTQDGGRKIVSHEFPERDTPYHEDMGRTARTFRLSCYVIGDDYFTEREDLIAALETKGPGRLVHPYRGIFQVVVDGFSVSESTDEGRMARFDINLKEDLGEEGLTQATRNTASAPVAAREQLYTALQDTLIDELPMEYKIGAILDAATATVSKGSAMVAKARAATVGRVSAFQSKVDALITSPLTVVMDAVALGREIKAIVDWGMDPLAKIKPAVEALNRALKEAFAITKNTTTAPLTTTPTLPMDIGQEAEGPAVIQTYIGDAAMASAVGVVGLISLNSVEETLLLRDQYFAGLDAIQARENVSDAIFEAVMEAKSAISSNLNARILNLSQDAEYRIREAVPTLVVSNSVYGEITQEETIISRNGIRHPGFCSPLTPLKVQVYG